MWERFLVVLTVAVVNTSGNDWHEKWPTRSKYYSTNLETTLSEILELNRDCKSTAKVLPVGEIRVPQNDNELFITEIPVKEEIYDFWKTMGRAQVRADPAVCQPLPGKIPFLNHSGCRLYGYMNKYAPRCQQSYLREICDSSSLPIYDRALPQYVPLEADHPHLTPPPQPWLLTARNALVSRCGVISYRCGFAHSSVSCFFESARGAACPLAALLPREKVIRDTGSGSVACKRSLNLTVEHFPRVFVVAEWDDSHIYHTLLEVISRIIYHKEFLVANPDIKIMFGCNSMRSRGMDLSLSVVKSILELLAIATERLVVQKDVFADEVYLPRYGGCQDPVYNTWEILTMRQHFLSLLPSLAPVPASHTPPSSSSSSPKPVILLMTRSPVTGFGRNKGDPVRQWSPEFISRFQEQLSASFPSYEVRIFSDTDSAVMSCLPCHAKIFSEADILIGVHGAGFANQMYMKPNSVVVEICPFGNDGRCFLGGGPFSRGAFVLSHHYLVHQPPYEEFRWFKKSSEFNLSRLVEHLRSFLLGLGKPI